MQLKSEEQEQSSGLRVKSVLHTTVVSRETVLAEIAAFFREQKDDVTELSRALARKAQDDAGALTNSLRGFESLDPLIDGPNGLFLAANAFPAVAKSRNSGLAGLQDLAALIQEAKATKQSMGQLAVLLAQPNTVHAWSEAVSYVHRALSLADFFSSSEMPVQFQQMVEELFSEASSSGVMLRILLLLLL